MRAALLGLATSLGACGPPPAPAGRAPGRAVSALPQVDWAKHGLASAGCFLVRDLATLDERQSDAARCAVPRRPNSTFKLPNALIGLELGLLDGPDAMMQWDREAYPAQSYWSEEWKKDQPLRAAMKVSAVPLFRRLAAQIGPERMSSYLARFDYGNRDTSGRLDAIWLTGGLRITARQQVDFVARLAQGALPASPRAQSALREVLRQEDRGGARLFGKTGSGSLEHLPNDAPDGPMVGWMVGWVEHGRGTFAYAMWVEGPSFAAMRDTRTRTVGAVLDELLAPRFGP